MDQHKLYRTIKLLSETKVRTDEQLLAHILENIIQIEEIPIKGGRIWKLEPASGSYRMTRQVGEVEHIRKSFRLRVLDYPMFLQLPRKGTIVGTETNKYLRQRGIKLYSATGVGEKVRWKGYELFPFVIAINSEHIKQDLTYTLNIIGHALTSALKNRTIESKAEVLQRDLDKAREIQKSILPEHEFRFHNYDLYGISLPERIVGGDFFDYLQASTDKERLGVVIGDAASKGLSAAAQALYVSGALRMGIEYQTKIRTFIGRINMLVNKTFSTEHFISMVYAELNDSANGLVQYLNAGHCNPILFHAANGNVELLPATGQIIGPFPNEKYKTDFTVMNKGDILVLYTDGITEAADENRTMYGEDRLVQKVIEWKTKTPREICRLLIEDVQVHNRLIEYSDDKTVVVIKRTR
ncbi:MAG: serine/threonine-protein phosphatase [Ignavibacteria bacterium]|nr:serine/threonine-protein phosphatase [Ignavibacteria bacterium]